MSNLDTRPSTSTSWWTSLFRTMASAVLQQGSIPKHVAFIMDGNRRWARERRLKTFEGHSHGFSKLKEALDWCLDLGITTVTVYAFSLENFKRPKQEVDALFHLASEKFLELLENGDLIRKHQVSIRVLGDVSLLPKSLQRVIGRAVDSTKHYDKAVLNVCFSYTSRDEMTNSFRRIAQGVEDKDILARDVDSCLFEECLYTSNKPDLLIRTSGERRLSDFLLWQSAISTIVFLDVLWPNFSPWDLYMAIIQYQKDDRKRATRLALLNASATRRAGGRCTAEEALHHSQDGDDDGHDDVRSKEERVAAFLSKVRMERSAVFERLHHEKSSKLE